MSWAFAAHPPLSWCAGRSVSGLRERHQPRDCSVCASHSVLQRWFFRVRPTSKFQVSVWDYKRYRKSTGAGFLGVATIQLQRLLANISRCRKTMCESFQLRAKSGTGNVDAGKVFLSFKIVSEGSSRSRTVQ